MGNNQCCSFEGQCCRKVGRLTDCHISLFQPSVWSVFQRTHQQQATWSQDSWLSKGERFICQQKLGHRRWGVTLFCRSSGITKNCTLEKEYLVMSSWFEDMWNSLVEWLQSLFWSQEMELTLVGLQYSGKTTLVNVISVSRALIQNRYPKHVSKCFRLLIWPFYDLKLFVIVLLVTVGQKNFLRKKRQFVLMALTFTNDLQTGAYSEDMIPTVGFNMKRVTKGNVSIKLWDIGGQPRFSVYPFFSTSCFCDDPNTQQEACGNAIAEVLMPLCMCHFLGKRITLKFCCGWIWSWEVWISQKGVAWFDL